MYYFQDCPFASVFFIHCTCIVFCYLASWYLLISSCFYTVAEFSFSSISLHLVFYGVSTYKGPCHESDATKPLPHSIFKTDGLKNICAGFHLTNIFVFKFTIMCCFCFSITSVTIQLTVIHLWKWWRPVHGGDQYHFFCILVIFCDLFILPILLRWPSTVDRTLTSDV